jgi:hypothetical protein
MNNFRTQSVEEKIINAFEIKVSKIAAEKIDQVLEETYKLIYDQICEMFDEDANVFEVERCVDQICNSVTSRIQREMRNEL